MRKYSILVILSLLILFGCAQPGAEPLPTAPPIVEETKQVIIEIEAVGQIVHYQCQSFWTQDEFLKLSEDDLIARFKEKYNVDARDFEFSLDEAKKSTILICDIKGTTYNSNSYNFHWFLRDLPFDLYQFRQSEKELNYEGEVNGVPTKIRLIFPYTIAHCHEHVWPAK